MRLTVPFERLAVHLVQALLQLIRHGLAFLVSLLVLAGMGWVLAARGLTGRRRVLWLLVPLLTLGALIGLVGPGHLYAKRLEGPSLLILSDNHAITLLDVPSTVCAISAVVLGVWLLISRWRGEARS